MKIENIRIEDIDDFENHPFRVKDDEDMTALTESIKENGVLSPVIVRPKEGGRYEMISGHRRKRACEMLGITTIPAVITELSRDRAILVMVDSNIQRSKVLPSEKAFAYKMKLDAMKSQGKRTDLTSCPLETKLNSGSTVAQDSGESRAQIYRFIKLTNLIPELLNLVDEDIISISAGNELAAVDKESQKIVRDVMTDLQAVPSYAQSVLIRKYYEIGGKDDFRFDVWKALETEPKKQYMTFNQNRLRSLIPANLSPKEAEDYVVCALEKYRKMIRERNEIDR